MLLQSGHSAPTNATATIPVTNTTPTIYYILVTRPGMFANAITGTATLSYTRIA
jgi:hypothetical protein